jgi:hypothetical protein
MNGEDEQYPDSRAAAARLHPSLLAFVPPSLTAGNPVLLTPQRSLLPSLSQQVRMLGAAGTQLHINLCNSKQ